MTHIFISYAKKDTRDLAFALCDALSTVSDVTAWIDRSLAAGRSWESEIQREIRRCDVFVVLYSPDINRHLDNPQMPESYVLEELAYARYILGKPVIPVMAQPTEPPMGMTRIQYINFAAGAMSLGDLVARILSEAGVARAGPILAAPAPRPARARSIDILPAPFEWIDIPAGSVRIVEAGGYIPQGGQMFAVPAFSIARYPITNAHYATFIEAGGYHRKDWWTVAGWQQSGSKGWTTPGRWHDSRWNSADYPVVGVSWYEALAFCRWLTQTTGEAITLPTEQQWQRAAQGDDGRAYPWGGEWDASRCNTRESGSGSTSPVQRYAGLGDSPFGVVDMAGNVGEWCLTDFETGDQSCNQDAARRVVRGGSWFDEQDAVHVLRRPTNNPADRYSVIGFRVVRSASS